MHEKKFATIVLLAVAKHIISEKVFKLFKKHLNPDGKTFITAPTRICKPVLDTLAFFNILDKIKIKEHKHY
jgi:2-polyprenyl-3-methyl-5-hydroxy-6-metoxy-1,4-benzoquinol methylase